LRGAVPGAGAGDVIGCHCLGLVHGATEYQVLVTFTKGTGTRGAGFGGVESFHS
jgi:hypothetical protein